MKNEDKNIQNNNELEFEIEDISFDDATVKMDVNVDRKIDIEESISDDTPTFDNQPNQEIQNDMEDVSESNSGVNEENSISNVSDVPEEIDSSNDMVDTSDETEPSTQTENKEENDYNKLSNENDSKEQTSDISNKEKDKNEQPLEESKEKLNDESVDKKLEDESEKQTSQDKTDAEKTPSSSQENSQTQKNENNQPNSNENGGEKKEGVNDKNKTPENNNVRDNQNENNGGNVPSKKEENISKSSADKKRDEAKQKQENRNRNKNNKPNKNGGQKSSGGIKNRAKNFAQNKAAKNPAVQKAQQAKKKVEQAKKRVQQVKKAIAATKAAISTISTIISAIAAIGLPGIIILLALVIIIAVVVIFSPSFTMDSGSETNISSADQKTQEKLNDIYAKYPNASKSLGTISVVYPYFPELWGVDTLSCLRESSDTSTDVEYSEEEADTAEDDTEDITSEDAVQDDEYLKFFQKWKYRKRLKTFMKKLEGTDVDNYLNYLETDIFDKNGYGYDDMFEKSTCSTENLTSYIKKDLKGLKNSFSTTTFSSLNRDADRNKIREFVDAYVGDPATGGEKIPYYEGGLADNAGYSGNKFNTDVSADSAGRTKKGLGSAGFVNWVYWSVVKENFGNQNSIDNIIAKSREITLDDLKNGDMGYDEGKTVIAIYNDGQWVYEDAATGYVVSDTGGGKFTKYIRANYFQNEMYNFTVRTTVPTPEEWNTDRIPIFKWPSTDTLIGECVFYAKNRALEIIQELYNNGSLNDVQYKTYKDRIWNYSGNADEFWYKNTSGNPGSVWKGYSDNSRSAVISDVRAGAILGATSTSTQGAVYGHVLIIEYANPDENKIIVSDMWNGTRTDCTKKDFKCISFRVETFTYEEFYNRYKEGSKTSFRGYLFFLYNN